MAAAVALVTALSACEHDTRPIVVTDVHNVIVDMPAGVRWDVIGLTPAECDQSGGSFVIETDTCEGVDF